MVIYQTIHYEPLVEQLSVQSRLSPRCSCMLKASNSRRKALRRVRESRFWDRARLRNASEILVLRLLVVNLVVTSRLEPTTRGLQGFCKIHGAGVAWCSLGFCFDSSVVTQDDQEICSKLIQEENEQITGLQDTNLRVVMSPLVLMFKFLLNLEYINTHPARSSIRMRNRHCLDYTIYECSWALCCPYASIYCALAPLKSRRLPFLIFHQRSGRDMAERFMAN